jgi:beta-lactamase class A
MKHLDHTLEEVAADYIRRGKAARISLSICNLETRHWSGVKVKDQFAPGSMMKLPIMIAYLKLAEFDPGMLSQQLTYELPLSHRDDEDILSVSPLVVGQRYTLDQLMRGMIVNSDNNAMYILTTHIDQVILHKILKDFDIYIPKDPRQLNFMTTERFVRIVEKLYDASYLNREGSQKALALLLESTYKPMANALPNDVVVASKFGERVIKRAGGIVEKAELHECGIVYAQRNPYSLCIMTEGNDRDTLSSIISDISATVYEKMH